MQVMVSQEAYFFHRSSPKKIIELEDARKYIRLIDHLLDRRQYIHPLNWLFPVKIIFFLHDQQKWSFSQRMLRGCPLDVLWFYSFFPNIILEKNERSPRWVKCFGNSSRFQFENFFFCSRRLFCKIECKIKLVSPAQMV